MTRTIRQGARRSGKEDAGHSLFLGGCLFGFYGEHNSKIRKGSCSDVTSDSGLKLSTTFPSTQEFPSLRVDQYFSDT